MFLFDGLPWPLIGLFTIALVIIVSSLAWSITLLWGGRRYSGHNGFRGARGTPAPTPEAVDDYLWVVMVPALNEQVTIRDSVERLTALQATNRAILVIDDGSDDATPDILASLDVDDLEVLRRDASYARLGKADALNHAYRYLHETLLAPGGRFAGWSPEKVVVAVVDADGRVDASAPAYVAARLADESVGGVQLSVRIYNRANPLAWFQHAEFGIYGQLQQVGRTGRGTAGMGGNGQFNRLSALDSVVGEWTGPWRDTLTEDQDLGLRLIAAGWRGEQEDRVAVEQQGLSNLRRLYRQRTRWAQGNLQAIPHARSIAGTDLAPIAKGDLLFSLAMPLMQIVVGVSSLIAIGLAVLGVSLVPDSRYGWVLIVAVLVLAFGGTFVGLIARARGTGLVGVLLALVLTVPYALYAWLMWPVLLRAVWRQVIGASSWAKTAREPLEDPADREVVDARAA